MQNKNESLEDIMREIRELLKQGLTVEKVKSLSVLTIKEVQSILPFGENQIRYYAAEGIIPSRKLGRHYIFNAEKINEWAKSEDFTNCTRHSIRASKRKNKRNPDNK